MSGFLLPLQPILKLISVGFADIDPMVFYLNAVTFNRENFGEVDDIRLVNPHKI